MRSRLDQDRWRGLDSSGERAFLLVVGAENSSKCTHSVVSLELSTGANPFHWLLDRCMR